MTTLKEQIDELVEQMDEDDDAFVVATEDIRQAIEFEDRIKALELKVKALDGQGDTLELWHKMNRAAIDAIVETIDGKEE